MIKFLKSQRTINLTDNLPEIFDVLPTATYALCSDPKGTLYLEQIEDFTMPEKLFGTVGRTAERVCNTFDTRSGVTGMLLTGEKGSGKTLLGKQVALKLKAEKDMPIIVVNIPVSGDAFGGFLQKLGKPVTLFFDEFEKVYNHPEYQNGLLTVLDGVYPIKMMAILTANDQSKMISPLIDRPGRVFYKIDYAGLEYAFIMEYAAEKLKNHDHLPELGRLATMADLNFDQLQALIEEMNRYDESVKEAVQLLNISMSKGSQSMKVTRITDQGKSIPTETWNSAFFYGDLTTLGVGEDDDEDDTLRFGYMLPLQEPMTVYEYAAQVNRSGGPNWATVRDLFNKISYREGSEQMPGMPTIIEFDKTAKIDVSAQGLITLSNEAGQTVTLEKTVKSYTKRF